MMTLQAQPYPEIGSVMVATAHKTLGPRGWHGNKHNDAIGWYWFQALPNTLPPLRSEVFAHRSEAEADAERHFPNITGWNARRSSYRYAEVKETP